jgi:hypothetical protein
MENNVLVLNSQILLKLSEARKSCDDVILIIFDDKTNNFSGYCKYKYEIKENRDYDLSSLEKQLDFKYALLKIEYLWKTKLSSTKIELLRNPLQDNEFVINSKDGQEIAIDTGFYMCRLMIKRLTREEVQDYLTLKSEHARNNKYNDYYNNVTGIKISNEEPKIINISDVKLKPRTFDLQDNLNSIINEEINRGNHNSKSNNIIVTNISNLQVNISQNSYRDDGNRKRSRSRSPNAKRRRKSRRKRSSSYSRSDSEETVKISEKIEILKNKRRRSKSKEDRETKESKNESSNNYNNSSTSVSTAFGNCSFFNSNTSLVEPETPKQIEAFQDKKFKSKLFSNAMQRITNNFNKKENSSKKF